ncbi:MAG: exonuclease SbcCD subunit D [Dehalococcoidia bacterium]
MRFLHTSDWHVGKPLRNQKRDDEYAAALAEVLAIAKSEHVDCVLIAGDVFDSAVPPHEAERIVFHFFGELAGAEIPAVVIAGNHDHPRRWNAYAPVLRHLGIHVRGEPVSIDEGGVIEMPSRDGSETAVIAALPWVSERKVRDFESLMLEGAHLQEYAEGVAKMMKHLSTAFRPGAVNLLITHVLLEDAKIGGPESGERPLHMGQAYVVRRQALPSEAQYIALGHVHMPQDTGLANGCYSGSLLQCDFGEAGQQKRVAIVDIAPGRKAQVQSVPLTSPKQLRNVGTHKAGVTLDELKALAPDVREDYVKVFVKVDRPLPGLAEQVREIIPNAVDIVVERMDVETQDDGPSVQGMSAEELMTTYYTGTYGTAPDPKLVALFTRLHEEVASAAD